MLAAFVLANAAAAMEDEVTMFFTFWGLNVLRKEHPPHPEKTVLQKMFGRMMPRGPEHLALSHLNFAGMGPVLMKKAMRDAHVLSLQDLIDSAREQGVKYRRLHDVDGRHRHQRRGTRRRHRVRRRCRLSRRSRRGECQPLHLRLLHSPSRRRRRTTTSSSSAPASAGWSRRSSSATWAIASSLSRRRRASAAG